MSCACGFLGSQLSERYLQTFSCPSLVPWVTKYSPWLKPTPAVKMPEAVVRPWSHIPSFGGHYCPGVSRPVPADGDSSFFSSGPILPSLLSNLKHTSDGMSGLGGQRLQCCTVSSVSSASWAELLAACSRATGQGLLRSSGQASVTWR